MQGIIMALFWMSQGMGSLLGTVIMSAFRRLWFSGADINCRIKCLDGKPKYCKECHLDYYFFVLAGIEIAAIFLFLAIAVKLGIGGVAASRKRYPGIRSGSGTNSQPSSETQSETESNTVQRHIQRRPRLSLGSSVDSDGTR